MKRFLCSIASCLVVAAVPAVADDVIELNGLQAKIIFRTKKDGKIDKDKLVGVWEAKKSAFDLPKGKWEFKDDGTLEVSAKGSISFGGGEGGTDSTLSVASGKYGVDGNKLGLTLTYNPLLGGKEVTHKATITKLTDKELQMKDKKGKVYEFTKKTEK